MNRKPYNTDISDAAWSIPHAGDYYLLVIRHDSSSVRTEIYQYILRITGLVVIIAAVVTLTTLIVLGAIVITPILKLRQDLLTAGESVSRDQLATHFYSASVLRQDELGDVIAAFHQMFQQIWQAMSDRKAAEQELAIANQQITDLNHQLAAENLRMSAELEVSRKLQQFLLPKPEELSQIPNLDIAGFMEPATILVQSGTLFTPTTNHYFCSTTAKSWSKGSAVMIKSEISLLFILQPA